MKKRTYSTFMLKQRAFLKVYLISMAENDRLYGAQFLNAVRNEFKQFGYRPTHSEIYKSLHELMESGILKRTRKIKKGTKLQEVIYYQINHRDKAEQYKKMLKVELDRCKGLLSKALHDIYP